MTDIEKIREKVEKLKSQLLRGACSSQIAMETRCKEEAYNEVLAILDFMQEEPVKRTPADIEAAMQEVEEKSRAFTEVHKGEDTDTILAQMRGEEPVSEDLGEYIDKLSKQFPEVSFAKLSRIAVRVAKWQKQKDNNNANHALVEQIKTQQMCYEKGVADMKQQMLAKAIDVEVKGDACGYPYIPQMELYDYDKDITLAKEGDRYKVILIKEG